MAHYHVKGFIDDMGSFDFLVEAASYEEKQSTTLLHLNSMRAYDGLPVLNVRHFDFSDLETSIEDQIKNELERLPREMDDPVTCHVRTLRTDDMPTLTLTRGDGTPLSKDESLEFLLRMDLEDIHALEGSDLEDDLTTYFSVYEIDALSDLTQEMLDTERRDKGIVMVIEDKLSM